MILNLQVNHCGFVFNRIWSDFFKLRIVYFVVDSQFKKQWMDAKDKYILSYINCILKFLLKYLQKSTNSPKVRYLNTTKSGNSLQTSPFSPHGWLMCWLDCGMANQGLALSRMSGMWALDWWVKCTSRNTTSWVCMLKWRTTLKKKKRFSVSYTGWQHVQNLTSITVFGLKLGIICWFMY